MADKELLELAANAYWKDEIDDVCSIEWDEVDQCIAYTHADNQDHNGEDRTFLWDPLTNDGDALRLAVRLNIPTSPEEVNGMTWVCRGELQVFEPHNGDPYAATRRAIVRAAAQLALASEEIGKGMK